MPNWCMNELKVTGPEDEIKRFAELAQTPKPCKEWCDTKINTYALLGIEYKAGIDLKKGFDNGKIIPGWFFWGDVTLAKDKKGKTILYASYDTRWSPEEDTLAAISKAFPTLKFLNSYEEPGECFSGTTHYKGGNMVRSTSKEW